MLNSSIFKAYDIRGIYPDELDEETAYKIGRAFSCFLKKENENIKEIIVGYDSRVSSPILKRSFIEGVANEGINVWDIGEVMVDMVYFASGCFNLPAAMITASHNSDNWNGFKLMKNSIEFFDSENIEIIINENKSVLANKKGEVKKEDIRNDYLKHILNFVDVNTIRPMRIAIDINSGVIGPVLKLVFEKLPLEINNEHYQIGCVFDCDADRVHFIDENGERVNPSIIGALMARYFLKQYPRGRIVYNATTSQIIPDIVKTYNGEAIRERVGHTFIKNRLKEIDGIFGIESSGHYYFKNNFYADSGMISLLVMIQILSLEKKSLSVLVSEFSKYISIPEMNLEVTSPEEFIKKIAQSFEGYDIDWLDGLTVRTPDFWLNLRLSNTEPVVRLNIEAKDELILNRVKDDLLRLIEKVK